MKYLPQEYIETVCNELQEHDGGKFSQELASVIFSHVGPGERLDCTTFDELLKYKTSERQQAVEVRRQSLRTDIEQLVEQERLSSPSHLQGIKEQIEAKKRELVAYDLTKPKEVPKPVEDKATPALTEAAEVKLKELADKIAALQLQIDSAKVLLATANRKVAAADRLSTRITSFEAAVEMLRQQSVKDCEALGLSLDDLIKVTVDTTRLKEVRALADTESKAQSVLLDPEREDGPSKRIAGCEKEIADIKATLAGPSQKYQQYVTELQQWTKRRAAIEGSEERRRIRSSTSRNS